MAQGARQNTRKEHPSEAEVEQLLNDLSEQLRGDIFRSLLTRGAILLTLLTLLALGGLAAYKFLPGLLGQVIARFF